MPKETKEQLKDKIKQLEFLLKTKEEEIVKLKAENKVLGMFTHHIPSISIACERTSDAMAHIVHDMLEYTKRR